jgi:3-hydroxyisobutyrate dehydrogenase-like beta-hydroxyacid dehydrogenase
MCKNLVEKGNLDRPLILYNRTVQRSEDLAAKLGKDKTLVVKSVEEAVSQSDIIFACLLNDQAIEETVVAAIKAVIKGKIFVDCSTVHPDTTNKLAKLIEGAGASFVACPVFGAPIMAENGQLICVLAGASAAVDKVRPYCKGVMGRAEIDFSNESPGKASLLKVIGNTFVTQMCEAVAEGHTVAEKTGLGSENLHKFIEQLFPGPYVAYSTRMMSGAYYNGEVSACKAV